MCSGLTRGGDELMALALDKPEDVQVRDALNAVWTGKTEPDLANGCLLRPSVVGQWRPSDRARLADHNGRPCLQQP